jgi:predicted nucleic acid-binding protein
MALYDLADPALTLPPQLVLDSSLLLALRPGDDNPNALTVQGFVRRLRQQIAAYQMVAWLPRPVLQECYHVILANSLRRAWAAIDPVARPPNWLVMYKREPKLLEVGFVALAEFEEILSTIPLTLAQPEDLVISVDAKPLEERLRYFITAYYLLPQDAMILSEAERLGVMAVATLDLDWRRATAFDIYTCPVE